MNDTPVHRRTIEVDSYEEGATLRVIGRLRDERPQQDRRVLHDMELQLQVSLPDLKIAQAQAQMHAFPHEECPFIAPKFASMVGLSVSRGFTRGLRELFAGVSGCTHLHELARAMGPAIFQANAALRAGQRDSVAEDEPIDPSVVMLSLRGSCHIWRPDGTGQQKLELGWLPGGPEYPVPLLERLRERA
ncbi:MAG TPA: DUF2889 domain-containing protein [Streptosporangiaceae bacterium]